MPDETSQANERKPDRRPDSSATEQERLDRIAEELAKRSGQRQKLYDTQHDIFSK